MRLSKRIVAAVALLATSLATAVSFPVRAADEEAVNYEVGKALICDTQAQAERFVALFNGDAPAKTGIAQGQSRKDREQRRVRRVRRRLSLQGGQHQRRDKVFARAADPLIRKAALACRREPMTVTTWPPRG